MEFYLLLLAQGIFAIFVLIGLSILYGEVKKGNKDQQEIKTRLTWSRKRELKTLKQIKK